MLNRNGVHAAAAALAGARGGVKERRKRSARRRGHCCGYIGNWGKNLQNLSRGWLNEQKTTKLYEVSRRCNCR
jgi:hypothetical protein